MRKRQALAKELEKAERRNAELMSSNSSLGAELANFKIYMRDAGTRRAKYRVFCPTCSPFNRYLVTYVAQISSRVPKNRPRDILVNVV